VDARQFRPLLEQLEDADADVRPALAFLAGAELELDEAELNASRRRALFLLAAGGDPRSGLDVDGRAVTTLADELDEPSRRAELARALEAFRPHAAGLTRVAGALDSLLADDRLAWRAFACALLADELDV